MQELLETLNSFILAGVDEVIDDNPRNLLQEQKKNNIIKQNFIPKKSV